MHYSFKILGIIFSKKPISLTKDPIWELFLRIADELYLKRLNFRYHLSRESFQFLFPPL